MTAITLPAEPILKAQAHKLKAFLANKDIALSHMTCLEAVASQYGHASWNHLRAALEAQPQIAQGSTSRSPGVSEVETVLTNALMSYEHALKALAVRLTRGRGTPTLTQFSGLLDERNDDNTRHLGVSVEIELDSDTTLELELRVTYSNNFGELDVSGGFNVSVTRPGYGRDDRNGWRADKVEIIEGTSFDGTILRLDEPDWHKQLHQDLQGLNLEEIFLEAWAPRSSGDVDTIAQEFSQRIPGWPAEQLQFNGDQNNEYEVSVVCPTTGKVFFCDTTWAPNMDEAFSEYEADVAKAVSSAAKEGLSITPTVTLLSEEEA